LSAHTGDSQEEAGGALEDELEIEGEESNKSEEDLVNDEIEDEKEA
jgi:hypothetical protein